MLENNIISKDSNVKDKNLNINDVEAQITDWHCDTYCRKVRHVSCEGEKGRNPNSPNRCPYLDEMLY